MKRIGIFGGSFDPVHLGHLLVAQAAFEELSLDRLYFIPAAQSPFKPGRQPTVAVERLRLLRLALAGIAWAQVDDLELRRGGVSYTIDTVLAYRQQYPTSELFYLVGADHVPLLPQWRSAEALAQAAQFVAIPRPGQPELQFPPPFHGRFLRGFPLAISSSQIRGRVEAGQSIRHLVPEAVAEAITKYQLYL